MSVEAILVIAFTSVIIVFIIRLLTAKYSLSATVKTKSFDYLRGLNYLLEEKPDKAIDEFIRVLSVDTETVETHIALGSLFRRRGEVDRAIRIHQNLIARPQLNKVQRIQALYELAKDYLSAGVLDRAERLFIEVIESGLYITESMQHLLDIYQQEKSWENAIKVATKLALNDADKMLQVIAHYYCELACEAFISDDIGLAKSYLKKALSNDKHCVRAHMLIGETEVKAKRFKPALSAYKKIVALKPEYIGVVLPAIEQCYSQLKQQQRYGEFLEEYLQQRSDVAVVLARAKLLYNTDGANEAVAFIAQQLKNSPSMQTLIQFVEMSKTAADGLQYKQVLDQVSNALQSVLSHEANFQCKQCGFTGKTLHWMCPSCRQWGVVEPILEVK